ncbi:MAG: hypothetical protein GC145_00885 [Caulobacter sp.]|nr:hypothetical protein [Caulobacter sp.]
MIALVFALALTAESTLAGVWTVDLSARPDEPYTRPMTLTLNPDGTVTGSFYESDIEAGRWKTARGRTCASFRTTDGVGFYHTSVCLIGDQAVGQTWAEQRNFLFNWDAMRTTTPEIPSP